MIVSCDQKVYAIRPCCETFSLIISVYKRLQFSFRITHSSVIRNYNEFAAFLRHLRNIHGGLISCGQLLIIRMCKSHPGIVRRIRPARDVSVSDPEYAYLMFVTVYLYRLSDIRSEYGVAFFMSAVTSVIADIACNNRDPVFFQILIHIAHDIPAVIEFMITRDKGIISGLLKAYRH